MTANTTDISGDGLIRTWTITELIPASMDGYWINPDPPVKWWPESAEIEPAPPGAFHGVWASFRLVLPVSASESGHLVEGELSEPADAEAEGDRGGEC